jgi:hypothetical protein
MNIGFHSNQLGLRGTEIALYEYAYYAREYLDVHPYIISDKNANLDALEKFANTFPVLLYDNFSEVTKLVDSNNLTAIYYQKSGEFDHKLVPNAHNLVHAVFQKKQPHGEKYAYISKWLADSMQWPHYVPYIVDITKHIHEWNLREYLNIPTDAFVFGYHGGRDSFNIPWVKEAVQRVVNTRSDCYFVFMNGEPFGEPSDRILFLEGTHDMTKKVAFINTCDAMLHARNGGESFGLCVAEFSSLNKPVLTTTWASVALNDLAHIDMLGNKSILYTPDSILTILTNIQKSDVVGKDWNAYIKYDSETVMKKFKETFL